MSSMNQLVIDIVGRLIGECMGGDLGGLGGMVPPKNKLRWGDGQCIRPPNIFRSSVIGCVWKYELSKTWCHEGIFYSETEVFRKEKGHI